MATASLIADLIEIDDEFRTIIPPLAPEELRQLEQNIVDDGCRESLTVWAYTKRPEELHENGLGVCKGDDCSRQSTQLPPDSWVAGDGVYECPNCRYGIAPLEWKYILVDGHNRLEICRRLGIPYEVTEIEFQNRQEALLWIIDNQFGRRNLADIDRIALARKREAVLRPMAKENLSKGGGDQKSGLAKLPKAIVSIDTRKEAAKTAGVGERTYDAGKLILDAAEKGEIAPEVVEAVRRKETSIHRVAKDIKEKRQAEGRKQKRAEAAATVEPQFFDNVHVGDFRQHADKVANGSLSLIFTDPPYDRKAIELFDGLGQFANDKLAEGGSLLAYVGHIQIPDALEALSKHLRYWWVCCCLHSGGNSLMREYGIRVGWKAILWFVKGTRDDKQNIVLDVVSGGKEKSHHDWQQSQAEAEYWIENLCPKDGIVCDPFLGGGTTAAAAIALDRKWVGFEVDHDQAVIAMTRCKK